ncbi:MAG: hypothetical protein LH467_15025 [Gemmatimonadaceae bacterium]|nr:hypothetical protein [Gemmatimonadaceae bacterium]
MLAPPIVRSAETIDEMDEASATRPIGGSGEPFAPVAIDVPPTGVMDVPPVDGPMIAADELTPSTCVPFCTALGAGYVAVITASLPAVAARHAHTE